MPAASRATLLLLCGAATFISCASADSLPHNVLEELSLPLTPLTGVEESLLPRTCHMTADESCPLTAMPVGERTFVYPGGATRCISEKTTPFAFEVSRRRRAGIPRSLLLPFICLDIFGAPRS